MVGPRLLTSAVAAAPAVLPSVSRALTTRLVLPAAIGTVAVHVAKPLPLVASTPLTRTSATPSASWAEPRTVSVVDCVYEMAGGKTIPATGGVVLTVHVAEAGVASTLPAASRARIRKVCAPSDNAFTEYGLVTAAKAALSRLASNVAVASGEVKETDVVADATVPDGGLVNCVSGATVSTVQVTEAGVGSMLPAASRARTSKVWLPSARLFSACGLVAAAKAAPSRRVSNVEPVSFEEKEMDAVVALFGEAIVVPMVVSGAVVSGGGGGGGLPPPPPPPQPTSASSRVETGMSRDPAGFCRMMFPAGLSLLSGCTWVRNAC